MYSLLHENKPRQHPEGKDTILLVQKLFSLGLSRNDISKHLTIKYKNVCRYLKLLIEVVMRRVASKRIGSGRTKTTSNLFDLTLLNYIRVLRKLGLALHSRTVAVAAKRLAREPGLSEDNGHLGLTHSWAKDWLHRNNMVIRRITSTKAGSIPENWLNLGDDMINQIKYLMNKYKITSNLVLNSDETPIYVESNYNTTVEEKALRTPVTTISFNHEKERVTIFLTITSTGDNLTPFVVVKGSRVSSLVTKEVTKICFIHANDNAWMTTPLTIEYINEVIIPYTKIKYCILLWDCFICHFNEEVQKICLDNHIIIVLVPPKTTPVLQPLDIAVNKSLKDYIKNKSEEEKINQIKCTDIDDDIYLKAPNRSIGLKGIGFFENTLLINSLDNEYVFESVRKFNLTTTYNNKKVLNIGLALHEIISDNIIFTSDENKINENFNYHMLEIFIKVKF